LAETRFTVIGAGNGGKAMAAHLSLKGHQVTLYNRTWDHIAPIHARGGIDLVGPAPDLCGFAHIKTVTSDLSLALSQADVVMVVVPASAHRCIAQQCAAHLRDGQVIVLNPGRTGGCLEFRTLLRNSGCTAQVVLAETETLVYACRSEGPAQARILRVKDAVPLAALPSSKTQITLDSLKEAFPQFIDGQSVLHTGLNNMGAIFHPALTLLNAARIESTGGEFQFYLEGATPSVARVLEALDRERVTVASAVGIRARTARDWLAMAYNATGANLHEAIQHQAGYRGIKAPTSLQYRYITEDVPMSLVPIAALGRRYGVKVAAIDSIVRLACIVHQTDYWRRGRTLDVLGIEQLSVGELRQFVLVGEANDDKEQSNQRIA